MEHPPINPLETALWKTQEVLALLRPYTHFNLPVTEEMTQEVTQLYIALRHAMIRAGEVMDRFMELHERNKS